MDFPALPSRAHIVGLAAMLLLSTACADQAEGERCDRLNGNADCEQGLVCTSAEDLNPFPGSRGAAICCPPEGTATTVEACFPATFTGTGDGGLPPLASSGAPDSGSASAGSGGASDGG